MSGPDEILDATSPLLRSVDDTLDPVQRSTVETIEGVPGPSSRPSRRGTLARGDVVGRYVVLAEIGAGGMGVVYAAYDPELDRKVALKLLLGGSPSASLGRLRLLREAQVLAKFSHPEIVGVHDVGEHAAGVWVAMEFIEGRTLGAWAKATARSWREILAVMLSAGRGVAAAHAAGLIHRDLKPDNIMVGDDGRVRVMDFGLTRAQSEAPSGERGDPNLLRRHDVLDAPLTQHGSLLGTPAYMAPEQFRGELVVPAADQFSFCVTFWELLFAERPFAGNTLGELASAVLAGQLRSPGKARRVPSWLRRTIQRGLAVEPGDRFASMQVLLSELARGQRRARGRVALLSVGVLGLLAAGAQGYRTYDRAERIAGCEAEGASIDRVWGAEARVRMREGLLATGKRDAAVTVEKVNPWLDAQALAWKQHRTSACLSAEVDESLDRATYERALWCLDERRLELAALIVELEHADASVVHEAVKAASSLAQISPCLDPGVLERRPLPPDGSARTRIAEVRAELARVDSLRATGKFERGLELAVLTRTHAEALSWPPLVAAAREREAVLLELSGRYAESEAMNEAAYFEAANASAWEVAADAATHLIHTIGYLQARGDEGISWAGHAELAATFAGDPLGLRAARRLGNLASVHSRSGAYEQARTLYEQALAIQEAIAPEQPAVARLLGNLAGVHYQTGAYAEAKALYERALAMQEAVFGREHPIVAGTLCNLAGVHGSLGEYAQTKALYERALAIQEQAFDPAHPDIAATLGNLGTLAFSTGAYAEAKPLFERTLAIQEQVLTPEHPELANTLINLASTEQVLGAVEQAKALSERALSIHEATLGPKHPYVARALVNLAGVHQQLGSRAEAKLLVERALAIQELALGPEHPEVGYTLSCLASLHALAGNHAEAKRLLERALAIHEETLEPDNLDIAVTLAGLGDSELALDHPQAARPLLERAVQIFDDHAGVQAGEGEAHFALARVLLATDDPTRAVVEAERARAALRDAKPPSPAQLVMLADIDAWLAERASKP